MNGRSADRDESVDVALLLLPVPPHARHRLVVVGRVPVGVEHDEPVGADQVESAPTRFAAQHEHELWTL